MNEGKEEGGQEIMSDATVQQAVARSLQFIFSRFFFLCYI
jgi:hypothetical protein